MGETIKLSVIMPVYNTEDYLRQCLDSLEDQTFQDFEIICVDDGSTDGSLDILREYEAADPRFHVICQHNKYAGVARNNGMKIAKGEYLIFLDSDDFFELNMLEKVYSKEIETRADVILWGTRQYDTITGEFIQKSHYFNKSYIPEGKEVFSRIDMPDTLLSITTPAPWTKAFRKEFILREGLKFQALSNTNDAYFCLTAMCLADKITYIDDCLVNYRINREGNLQDQNEKDPLCVLEAYEAIYDTLKEKGIYLEVEKTFTEAAILSCVYNIDTTKSQESQVRLWNAMQQENFSRMGILDHPDEYYSRMDCVNKLRGIKYALYWYEYLDKLKDNNNRPQILKRRDIESYISVSVIIPVYNVESYLRECLDSVLNQDLDNIEVICINDGSTDRSLDIILEYADKDSRISVYTQMNSGLSATRNAGIREAKGEYIYFMDSDDLLLQGALSKMYNKSKSLNLDIVYCDGSSFSSSPEYLGQTGSNKDYYNRSHSYSTGCYRGIDLLYEMESNDEYRASVCLQIIKRNFLIDNNLWFTRGILHEDNCFTFESMIYAERVGYISDALFSRRIRSDSIMTTKTSFAHVFGYYICFLQMERFFANFLGNNNSFTSEEENAATKIIYRILHNARNEFNDLDEDEKYSVWGLTPYLKTMFNLFVIEGGVNLAKYTETNEKLKKAYNDKSEINKKLQQAYNDKSEINKKLQQAYNDKSEINKKLQQTYKEKSEINRKLQTTYKEKAERGVQIKELNQKLEIANKKLSDSLDYKIGNIVLYFPRKIKHGLQKIMRKLSVIKKN